jgi:ribonuclease D
VDAERASSYRYSPKAYLVQIRTEAAGTALIDPTAFRLPRTFQDLLGQREWVLHAASQDLPCLVELGLHPGSLFDTELAARLLGMPRVGLGAVVEDTLGLTLAKEHSAADWSRRPLPEPWLVYAALDVEVLVEVREILAERLREAGKERWATEEFAHLVAHPVPKAPEEPWRKLHSLGSLRTPRQLAVARALWERRDGLAREGDLAPHIILKDKQIVAAAKAAETSRDEFTRALPRSQRGEVAWWRTARSALTLPTSHLPGREAGHPPAHSTWKRRRPEAWERLRRLRSALGERAEELQVPLENLLTPSVLRHWVWESFPDAGAADTDGVGTVSGADETAIAQRLRELGARPWQAEITSVVIQETLATS